MHDMDEVTTSRKGGMFALLDTECIVGILLNLSPPDIAQVGRCCKLLAAVSKDPVLWRTKYERRFLREPFPLEPEDGQWCKLYKEVDAWTRMKALAWERLHVSGGCRPPSAREGHACAPLDDNHIIFFGGFGHRIQNDVYILELLPDFQARWHKPIILGNVPARYGHSFVRCGHDRDMFLAFGGLTRGGYVGETDSLAVLKRVPGHADATKSPSRWTFEWQDIKPKGDKVQKRGYAALAVSEDGGTVYAFGGICNRDCCDVLSALDVSTWTWSTPDCHGEGPCKRFGGAAAVWDNKLWIVGGGRGNDLLRSGMDLTDVYTLDLASFVWEKVEVAEQPSKNDAMGRCNAYHAVGSKLIMYGGSLRTCSDLHVLDMANCTWIVPTLCSMKPKRRMSCVVAWVRGKLVMHGGWVHSLAQVGDLYMADLTLGNAAIASLEPAIKQTPSTSEQAAEPTMQAGCTAGRPPSCSGAAQAAGAGIANNYNPRRVAVLTSRALGGDENASTCSSDSDEMDVAMEVNPRALAMYAQVKAEYEALCSATSASFSTSGSINIGHFFRMEAMRSNLMELQRQVNGFTGMDDEDLDLPRTSNDGNDEYVAAI